MSMELIIRASKGDKKAWKILSDNLEKSANAVVRSRGGIVKEKEILK